ncbi:hypothetical protein N7495_003127 [Penicillium taxi]|uniref:uncharacterized protein n=1 Tax=Penicillium taxi TaxID=168475 RepID=UPI00254501FE|nr:uncharacterized protein N7495_003127 [Penicillium taxi]KAJ5902599.1 hypothetical protein N7495_003127 [Penicillium taxi]
MTQIEDSSEYELLSTAERDAQEPTKITPKGDWPGIAQKVRRWKWGSITVDILGILLVVPFLFLIIFCASRDGETVDAHTLNRMKQGLWASATAFTLVFSSIVGRMTRRMAEWRLERGSSLKTLETLNGSSTLINSVLTQVQLRNFGIVSLFLVLLWTVSPIGSQSPLHVLSTASTSNSTQQLLGYPLINSSSLVNGADGWSFIAPYIQSIYSTSLLSAANFGNSSMDPWNNLKIPKFDGLQGVNSTGWASVPTNQNISYPSLMGIPISGLNKTGNITAIVESTYFTLQLVNSTGDLKFDGKGIVLNMTVGDTFTPWSDTSLAVIIENDTVSTNASTVTPEEEAYITFSPVNQTFQATYLWQQRYFQSEIKCIVQSTSAGQKNCSVEQMRVSRSTTPPEFEGISVEVIRSNWNKMLSGQNFSLSEAYLRYPQSPLEANLSDTSTASPSMEALQQRLEQLLNTLFFSTVDPEGLLSGMPSYPIQVDATRIFFNIGSVYVVNFRWLAAFVVATLVMTICAIITIFLTSMSMNPDILGYISTYVWNSPSVGLPRSGTFLGGDKKTRSIKEWQVRLGDVRSEDKVGQLSIGILSSTKKPEPGRLYRVITDEVNG